MTARIEAVRGDITTVAVDAIVNAANRSLLGGGGVDGAIHRAAGARLLDACRELRSGLLPDGLPTGEAVATPGFDLPARWVVHVVGPVYDPVLAERRRPLLTSCYMSALAVACGLGARSIAFPAVSAGVYGWPVHDAAQVAVDAMRTADPDLERVLFVLFTDDVFDAFTDALS